MDEVFKALADISRRKLIDELYIKDGQSVGELAAGMPRMSRIGVMKHLRILETAGLVVIRREGRRKLHFLNPLPIQRIHDRWIGRFTQPVLPKNAP
jgi:DNA-binding transcriptional ArsR family regulator